MATYSPADPRYWDPEDLQAELARIFDICHGCRLCYSLCPSFPALFEAFDTAEGEEATPQAVARRVGDKVADLCYQCKLCFDKCPYTPPHRFQLDFPRLMLRVRAQRARQKGVRPSDRYLGDPDRLGQAATALAPLANRMVHSPLARRLMERAVGVDRRQKLPDYARLPFRRWWRQRRRPPAVAPPQEQVALFVTCLVNYQYPQVGQAAVGVLEHNGVDVALAPGEVCCGMPALEGGDVAKAQERARRNVQALLPLVRAGRTVLVAEPTCGYMLRKEYPVLLATPEAEEVAQATMDLGEYLARRVRAGTLDQGFTEPLPQEVWYHAPCHLRAQNVGLPASSLLEALGVRVHVVERCSGMDGTWGMRAENFDLSQQIAQRLVRRLTEAGEGAAVCSDCALAGLQIQQLSGRTVRHPVEVLAQAYGLAQESGTAHP